MFEESSTYNNEGKAEDGSPLYDEYLPGPIQVLVEWLILLISTLLTYLGLKQKEEG